MSLLNTMDGCHCGDFDVDEDSPVNEYILSILGGFFSTFTHSEMGRKVS